MQRIMNNPDNIVDEMLKGFLKAHSDIVERHRERKSCKSKRHPGRKSRSRNRRRIRTQTGICRICWKKYV